MRFGVSILLLLLIGFQALLLLPLTQLSLEWHQFQVDQQLQEEEGNKELTRLSFSEREVRQKLDWKEKDEFELNGMMYDVVEAEQKQGRIVLTAYKDREEAEMKERNEALRKGSGQGEDQKKEERRVRVQPFKYFKGRSPRIIPPSSYRTLGRGILPKSAEEVFIGVPVPPPC